MRGRLFPGDRRIWQVAAVILAVIGGLVFWQLAKPRDVLIGANGVAARNTGNEVPSGQQLCVYRVRVPTGARTVRWTIDTRTAGKPAMDLEVRLWQSADRRGTAEVIRGKRTAEPTQVGLVPVPIRLDRNVPGESDSRLADLCLTPHGGSVFPWGNSLKGNTDRKVRINGRTIPGDQFRPSLEYLGGGDTTRSMLSRPQAIFERMSLFRPAFVGPWTYWLIFLLVLPTIAYGSIRLIAVADQRSVRRIAATAYVLAVAVGWTWALLTPTFQTPDESEHFAAVQYFAETGNAVDAAPDARRPVPWSQQEAVAIDATRVLASHEKRGAKLPWPAGYERAWQAAEKNHGKGLARDDGGGYHPAVSSHSPAYYALMSPAYLIARNHSPWAQVLAVRWWNALLAGLIAAFAVLAVAEVLPKRRNLAAAGGLIIVAQPMVGFMAGAINNDTAVNVAGAGIVWLVLRGLRRGLTWRIGLALGALLALAPIVKGTGYELFPPTMMAVLFMLWRGRRSKEAWLGLVLQFVSFAVVTATWAQASSGFHREVLTTPGGGGASSIPGLTDIPAYLNWMWQFLVPVYRLPGMIELTSVRWPFVNVYIERGFGAFGWYAIEFPSWVSLTIMAVSALLLFAGVVFLARHRSLLRAYLPELLFLAAVPITVVFAVEAAYANLTNIPYDGTPEQGRYGFPALVALAVITAGCCAAFGELRGRRIATGLVAALLGLTFAGQVMMIQSFYA